MVRGASRDDPGRYAGGVAVGAPVGDVPPARRRPGGLSVWLAPTRWLVSSRPGAGAAAELRRDPAAHGQGHRGRLGAFRWTVSYATSPCLASGSGSPSSIRSGATRRG